MKITKTHIHRFQQKVLDFYKKHKRDLPWRKTADPYKILLSELMLQQTQVPRVIQYYTKWIAQWPTIESLAHASRKEVLNAWLGLGYNSRAVHFHQTAQIISDNYHGDVLEAMNHYDELPGVGRYTARAVQIFAANVDMVTVDTNIRRILLHEFQLPHGTADQDLWTLAQQCLPKGKSKEWHNALMDYGALLVTAHKTGIPPKTRQSRFEGSDRQIRAQLLRFLLQQPASFGEIQKTFSIEQERLQRILDKMLHENLIFIHNKQYQMQE